MASWGDWLGTATVAYRDRKWRPFLEARSFVRSLGLTTQNEWIAFAKGELPEKGRLPQDVPANPRRI
jgi:hypothetical protein